MDNAELLTSIKNLINNPKLHTDKNIIKETLIKLKQLCNEKANFDLFAIGSTICYFCNDFLDEKGLNFHNFPNNCLASSHQACLINSLLRRNCIDEFDELDFLNNFKCFACKEKTSINLVKKTKDSSAIDRLKLYFFQCPICLKYKSIDNKCVTFDCNHQLCKECTSNYFEIEINNSQTNIKCPTCRELIDINTVKAYTKSKLFEKYDINLYKNSKSIDENEVYINCPRGGCYAIICCPINNRPTNYKCERCKLNFCTYGCPEGHSSSCEAYAQWRRENDKADELFEELCTKENIKKCPISGHNIQKTFGCNHMVCPCGKEFCYACLIEWKYCKIHNT